MSLVIVLQIGESVSIGDALVTVVGRTPGRVTLSINAPAETHIVRANAKVREAKV